MRTHSKTHYTGWINKELMHHNKSTLTGTGDISFTGYVCVARGMCPRGHLS